MNAVAFQTQTQNRSVPAPQSAYLTPVVALIWPIAIQRQALEAGYRRKSLPQKPIALQGASHEIVSPIAL